MSRAPGGSEANIAALIEGMAFSSSTVRGHICWAEAMFWPYHFRWKRFQPVLKNELKPASSFLSAALICPTAAPSW